MSEILLNFRGGKCEYSVKERHYLTICGLDRIRNLTKYASMGRNKLTDGFNTSIHLDIFLNICFGVIEICRIFAPLN